MNRGRTFLLVLLAIVSLVVFVIVLPFIEYVLFALILAYVLYPLHVRLVGFLVDNTPIDRLVEPLSALALIFGSLFAVVIPLLYVISAFLRDLQAIVRGTSSLRTDLIEARLSEVVGVDFGVNEAFAYAGEWLFTLFFGDISGLLTVLLQVSLGLALVLFLVFYLLLDGPALVAWLGTASPLEPDVRETLIEQIDRTTWGAVIGHAVAAVVQALVAGVGLYLVGIPNVVFWTIVMVMLAFLPLIGVFLVWAPASGYLYLVGDTSAALLLALYGLTAVSFVDYYVRPLVIDRQARLNPAVILVGVFGGVYTLGFVGLFVGPILIGVLVAIVETFRVEYTESTLADVRTTERQAVRGRDREPIGEDTDDAV